MARPFDTFGGLRVDTTPCPGLAALGYCLTPPSAARERAGGRARSLYRWTGTPVLARFCWGGARVKTLTWRPRQREKNLGWVLDCALGPICAPVWGLRGAR